MAIQVNNADEKFKTWYEKETGKEITPGEFEEAKQNMLEFISLPADWESKRQRDLNSEPDAGKTVR